MRRRAPAHVLATAQSLFSMATCVGSAGIYISTEKANLSPNPALKAFLDQLRFLRGYGPADPALLRNTGSQGQSKVDPTT